MVGKTGFEPATPWSQTKCSTKLSHFPINGAPEGIRTPDLLVRSRSKWRSVHVKMRPFTAIVNLRFSTKISMLSTLVKPLPRSIVVIIVVIPEPYGHRLYFPFFHCVVVKLWSCVVVKIVVRKFRQYDPLIPPQYYKTAYKILEEEKLDYQSFTLLIWEDSLRSGR